MIRINQLKLKSEIVHSAKASGEEVLKKLLAGRAAAALQLPQADILELEICRESIDARKKPDIFYIYTVEVRVKQEQKVLQRILNAGKKKKGKSGQGNVQITTGESVKYRFPESGEVLLKNRVVIVGTGPAGLFCGYFLAMHGYQPILLERGRCVEERQKDVECFWETGILDTASNVQFGEGGAGTFSDGKLNTLVKDKYGRNKAVLQVFVDCGATPEILYDAKPHIGTDVLCKVVKTMRERILAWGGEVRFESQMTDVVLEGNCLKGIYVNGTEYLACEQLVLATGHSARDTFAMLHDKKIPMEAKSFAVGLRVEHPQEMINESQYGMADAGDFGAAPYKVVAQADNGRGVYSFCMCPGGYVVNASSEEGRLAVNGMSYSGRNGRNANSAVIVAVTPQDFGSDHPLAGVGFQRRLEEKAYSLADGKIPMQRYGEFKSCVEKRKKQDASDTVQKVDTKSFLRDNACYGVEPENKGLCAWADVSQILPKECNEAFVQGMEAFGRQITGFDREDAILSGVESRTSSPIRIHRDETLQSEVRGIYPCGEGAGYAGGITSAAMDGLRVAEAIAAVYAPFEK